MRSASLFIAVTLVSIAIAACGGGDGGATVTPEPSNTAEPSATSTPLATAAATAEPETGPSLAELARGVVQIIALDANDNPIWSGSGTVVEAAGLILTNAHVVDDRDGEYSRLGVAVTDRTDVPPTPAFFAEVAAVDYVLDLAVVRIVSDLDGNPPLFQQPAVEIGNSDDVELGDGLQILGFPGIGGETITLTQGTVSGFNAQHSIATRAWIKTDAVISGGNSGGLAVNAIGQIIGIPTIAGSTEDVSPVDCRVIVDTNRDGVVNESDTCVPIGGFINGLRPVALALPLIQAARDETTYASAFGGEAQTSPDFDAGTVTFANLIFGDGVTEDDRPLNVARTLPSNAPVACAFWDYAGMADGLTWEALWFVDGELSETGSHTAQTWIGGPEGNWWVCLFNTEAGLTDGLYELVLSVEGELTATESFYLGGNHPIIQITIENLSADQICYVQMSPSDASNWGPDELGAEDIIEPQQSWTFEIPAATVDLRLLDCAENVLTEEYQLDASESGFYTLN